MAVDQDWTAVYPTAAPFKPSAVPLPVRMGYPVKRGVPPAKKGNLELIKVIKSFKLHLLKKNNTTTQADVQYTIFMFYIYCFDAQHSQMKQIKSLKSE